MATIVQVNVSQTAAPIPSTLQRTGAFLSQGATNTAPGTMSLLTQLADLTPLLTGAKSLSGIVQSAGLATATAASPHGFTVNDTILLTIAGANQAGYNGTFLCTITSTTAFTFAVASGTASPATGTLVYTEEDVAELLAMATTFYAQGGQNSVYVLELGPGNATDGVTFLAAWIAASPQFFYSYMVPRSWDGNAAFLAFLAGFESTTAKTYFFVTTTLATWTLYTALMKCVVPMIEAPQYGAWAANALSAISYTGAYPENDLTAISWSAANGGTVTATTTTDHGVLPGNYFTIAGCTPAGYNGTFVALPGTTGSTLIYALAANPGAETILGTLAVSTFGTVSATTTTAHGVLPGQWFTISGCLPVGYNGTFLALAGTTGSTLVYATPAALGAESLLGTLVASLYASAGIPALEFTLAAAFWVSLNYNPSSTNRVTPYAFSFLFGVTPFPTLGNAALLSKLKAGFINVVGTGAEGGLSDTILLWGTTLDGRDFTYWYSVDWMQINVELALANEVINGSNNPLNPLYDDQNGINRLQARTAAVVSSAITFGLALGTVQQTELDGPTFSNAISAGTYAGNAVVNAVPFVAYYEASPSDYRIGKYAGLAIVYTPARGFIQIIINVNVTDFVAP